MEERALISVPRSQASTTTAITTTSTVESTSTPPTTAAATLPNPSLAGVILGHDGLGIASFGDPLDEVLAVLSEAIGPPSEVIRDQEAMIEPSMGQYGGGPDATSVLAIWDDVGLLVAFSDYPFYRDDDVIHMSGWMVFASSPVSAAAHTAEGIGVGSTFAQVQAVYGDQFIWGDGECGPWAMLLPPGEDEARFRIVLWFIDLGAGDQSSLVGLGGGTGPGC
jgi:hypothetical protein